ncbi:TATA-binding protein-associated factor 2N isoform X2 [Austrofundulus limnaeus]|uniref:TATA-binding protein-associated factor 2N isoform X2 n=1 Tax=Austrofundulus limnaeus TaxID=52670 RepID=A0A2I4C0Y3_AUSLI|nr:PREDICTED: keratin, type I cytoskeletal 9-like isoform X2 [Austrofundulus limnaeus]
MRKLKKEMDIRNAANLKYLPKTGRFFSPVNVADFKSASVNEDHPASRNFSPAPELAYLQSPASSNSVSDSAVRAIVKGTGDDESPVTPPPGPLVESGSCTSTPPLSRDPALWGDITERLREEAISMGPAAFQNRSSYYPASGRESRLGGRWTRHLTNDLFHCQLPNNQIVSREWLLYSPSTGSVYCYACKLLSSQKHSFISGFSDWRHPQRLNDHEKSPDHRQNMLSILHRSKYACRLDASFARQLESEQQYWEEVLTRVGLPFGGDNELLDPADNGNSLGLLTEKHGSKDRDSGYGGSQGYGSYGGQQGGQGYGQGNTGGPYGGQNYSGYGQQGAAQENFGQPQQQSYGGYGQETSGYGDKPSYSQPGTGSSYGGQPQGGDSYGQQGSYGGQGGGGYGGGGGGGQGSGSYGGSQSQGGGTYGQQGSYGGQSSSGYGAGQGQGGGSAGGGSSSGGGGSGYGRWSEEPGEGGGGQGGRFGRDNGDRSEGGGFRGRGRGGGGYDRGGFDRSGGYDRGGYDRGSRGGPPGMGLSRLRLKG